MPALAEYTGDVLGWALFSGAATTFVGEATHGLDWSCPRCHEILIRSVHEGQILDLLFRCYRCSTICRTALREPGEPLALRSVLRFDPGDYPIDGSIVPNDQMIVGQQALYGYLAETGSIPREEAAEPEQLTPEFLRRAASAAADLLGEHYEVLRRTDRRGRASHTPPPSRHWLLELIDYAEAAACAMEERPDEPMDVDADRLTELVTVTTLFDRWKRHPAHEHLARTLASATEGRHTVILLAVAGYLTDLRNGVGIVVAAGAEPAPDLWVRPTCVGRLNIEVKTPQALRGPLGEPPLTELAADHVIENSLRDSSKQINAIHPGILAIGAFNLGGTSLDVLERAGQRILARRPRRAPMAALVFSMLGWEPGEESSLPTFRPVLGSRTVLNPNYNGAGGTLVTG